MAEIQQDQSGEEKKGQGINISGLFNTGKTRKLISQIAPKVFFSSTFLVVGVIVGIILIVLIIVLANAPIFPETYNQTTVLLEETESPTLTPEP